MAVLFVRPVARCVLVLCRPVSRCCVEYQTVTTMATVALTGTPTPLVPYLASASPLPGYTPPTLPSPQSTTPGYPAGAAHNYLYQKQREGG